MNKFLIYIFCICIGIASSFNFVLAKPYLCSGVEYDPESSPQKECSTIKYGQYNACMRYYKNENKCAPLKKSGQSSYDMCINALSDSYKDGAILYKQGKCKPFRTVSASQNKCTCKYKYIVADDGSIQIREKEARYCSSTTESACFVSLKSQLKKLHPNAKNLNSL